MLNPINIAKSSAKYVYSTAMSISQFLHQKIIVKINNIFKSAIALIASPFSKYERDQNLTLTDGRTITVQELKPKHRKIQVEENPVKNSGTLPFIYNI